tara:strand:+ start:3338 stop:5179 length:1842 start_codon:yes stop_codon:yes gene_type:complete
MVEQIFTESYQEIPSSQEKLQDLLKSLPQKPGVYKFLDERAFPIYIGKAKNLRNRVSSYFRQSSNKTKKVNRLVDSLKSIEVTLTNTELEALLLEQHLIKEKKPKFNAQFKDDKGYPWIKIESSKEFPSARSFLGKKDNNDKFFGPFPSSYAVQDSLKILQEIFKLRNCSDSFFKNRTRPCIQYEIDRCSAPCMGFISKEEYLQDVGLAELLLLGKSDQLITTFYNLMDKHSNNKSFEKAAFYRDKISSLRDVQRSQSIVGHSKERDSICICTVNGQTKAGVTHVREGWVTGHQNFIQKNLLLEGSALEYFIQTYYLNNVYCPSILVVGESINKKKILEQALSQYHDKNIKIISKLGKKDQGLLKICENNTKFSFDKTLNSRDASPALISLKEELNLPSEIKVIESYDISHHSGSAAVAGCVVFSERGRLKDKYKLFNISKENSGNDIASMVEAIERRFNSEVLDMELPNLIILDGGKVHLSHVIKSLKKLQVESVSVVAISKGVRRKTEMDTIHTESGSTIKISRESLAQKFIQEIRDETHRFSISIQKNKLRKLSVSSSLDNVNGVGPERKKALLRFFGSVEQIRRASTVDLVNVPGIGKKTATLILNQLE